MSSVVIAGNTSGSVTLQAPDVAGSTTLNLPTVSGGTLVTSDSSGNVGIGGTGSGQKLYVDSGSYLWSTKINSSNVVATALEIGNSTTRTWEVAIGGSAPAGSLPAGGIYLYDQAAGQARFAIDTSGILQFNSGYGSIANAYGCRAWVNFNGTGTVAIRGSGNVTSLTDNGVGVYTINFTTAMPDKNYCVVSAGQYVSAGAISHSPTIGIVGANFNANALNTGSAQVNSSNDAASATDPSTACIAVFR